MSVIEELSDVDNMMDENELEPDYYIDRPVRNYTVNNTLNVAITYILAKSRRRNQGHSGE